MGIIGGADGPTAIYLTSLFFDGEVSMGKLCLVLGVVGLIAYFIGNISPSTIMAKRQGIDIKKEGSGNAGTTNALRVMGKKAGAITCVVDILKGVVAVLIGMLAASNPGAYVCALCVFLGHVQVHELPETVQRHPVRPGHPPEGDHGTGGRALRRYHAGEGRIQGAVPVSGGRSEQVQRLTRIRRESHQLTHVRCGDPIRRSICLKRKKARSARSE